MNTHTIIFDRWIRKGFVEINSELEKLYWQQADKANVEGIGETLKEQLAHEVMRLLLTYSPRVTQMKALIALLIY